MTRSRRGCGSWWALVWPAAGKMRVCGDAGCGCDGASPDLHVRVTAKVKLYGMVRVSRFMVSRVRDRVVVIIAVRYLRTAVSFPIFFPGIYYLQHLA